MTPAHPTANRVPLVGLLVAALTFALFSPALNHQFVNFDDATFIVDNPHIRKLDADSIYGMCTTFCVSNYIPLTHLSSAIDYQIWGMNPRGFHFTNILLHSLNAGLVWLLARRIYRLAFSSSSPAAESWRGPLAAAVAALAFALHPLRVESVVWLSERRDVLSLFFLLLCTLAYLTAWNPLNPPRLRSCARIGSWFLLAAAFLSKASGVTLPVVFLLLDFYPLRRFTISRAGFRDFLRCVAGKIPYLILSLAIGLVALWGQSQKGALIDWQTYPWPARLINASLALVFYVQKWVCPWPLFPRYESFSAEAALTPASLLSIAWIILVTAASVLSARRRPGFAIAWWSYLVMILPFTGLLQAGVQTTADRYTYLATIPFALLMGALVLRCAAAPRLDRLRSAVIIGCAAALGLWSWLTVLQTSIWRNSFALWHYAIQEAPNEFLALNNYGAALIERGDLRLARVMTRATTRAKPGWDLGWHNYAIALSLTDRTEEAIRAYERALQLNPAGGDSHLALGNLLFLKGKAAEARHEYFAAIQCGPSGERLTHLAIALYETGHVDFALKTLARAALQRHPDAFLVWAEIMIQQAEPGKARNLLRLGYQVTRDPRIKARQDALAAPTAPKQ